MDILIAAVEGDDTDRGEDLYNWLLADVSLRPLVRRERYPARKGELGPVLGVLTVAAGSGGVLSVLAGALGAWLAQARNQKVSIRLQVGKDQKKTIQLEASNVKTEDIERMLDVLRSFDETHRQGDASGSNK